MRTLQCLACFAFLILAGSCGCKSPVVPPDSIDPTAEDSSVRPQNDFFNYVNGGWIKRTPMPPTEANWGVGIVLYYKVPADLRDIMDSLSGKPDLAKGSIEQQVADLYSSFMDTSGIETRGMKSLKASLARIEAIQNTQGVREEAALEQTEGLTPLFSLHVDADDSNSNVEVAHFDQGGQMARFPI